MQPKYDLVRSEQIYDDGEVTVVKYDVQDECEIRLVINNHTNNKIAIYYDVPKERDNYAPIYVPADEWVTLLYSEQALDWEEAFENKQFYKEDIKMSDIKVYESNTKGKEAFVKEVLTPVVQQYGYSVASYTGEDGKDEKVWLFKRSDRKIGFIDDAQFAVDVTADSVTALFEDILRCIEVIPDMRELLDKTSLIKACLDYIQSTTETCEEFANVMLRDLGMTKDEIEEYGKGYCLDVLEEQD